jgi:hypothetical protein
MRKLMTKLKISLLYFMLIGIFLHPQAVLADTGPKPTMDFEFELPSGVTITSAIMYECDESDCSDAEALPELGPQGIRCDELRCSSTSYGYAPYHRLEIQFSDGKIRQSNIFETIAFTSNYKVIVNADDLVVEEVSGSPAPPFEDFPAPTNTNPYIFYILGCVCILLLLGLITVAVIFFVRRSRKK